MVSAGGGCLEHRVHASQRVVFVRVVAVGVEGGVCVVLEAIFRGGGVLETETSGRISVFCIVYDTKGTKNGMKT